MRWTRLARAAQHPITEYHIQKAKRTHRKANPTCLICGYTPKKFQRGNDVHHQIPVHTDPSLACEPSNLFTLCRKHNCHFRWGHFEDYRRRYNKSVMGTVSRLKAVRGKLSMQFMVQEEG